jgi:hypothetical protein
MQAGMTGAVTHASHQAVDRARHGGIRTAHKYVTGELQGSGV